MHWRLQDVWDLPIEYYEVLVELAGKWLGGGVADEETEP